MHCFVIVLKRQLHDEIPRGEFCYLSDELLAKHVYIQIQNCHTVTSIGIARNTMATVTLKKRTLTMIL